MKKIISLSYFLLVEFLGLLLFRNPFTNHKKRKKKISICMSCEDFEDGKCLRCGCYMKFKTWFKKAKCPIGKW